VHQQNLSYDTFGRLSQRTTSQDGLKLAEETT
jgi:YD repeat-containing protein